MSVVIIYHSGYGHTKKLAEAVFQGVQAVNEMAILIAIDAEGNIPAEAWETLAKADTIIFGSPTYMGSVSWQFKKFADASSKAWLAQTWKDKLAAGFTNSASMNGDKLSTIHYLITLAMQHAMLWASSGFMPASTKAATRNDINYLGCFAGLISQSPSDASPEEGPLPGDLETAKLFGKRIAELTLARQTTKLT
ncbi:MAG: flavodoxin family protein [Gammaproteobacteria bacterium]|nr:flavodoxin family protein [Gammaproteobacteria bacterium]